MNTDTAAPLTPAVSAALAGWLALSGAERRTLQHAMTALDSLGRERPATGPRSHAHASPPVPPSCDAPITLDALPEVDRDLFRSGAYRSLGPGESIALYVAGCRGLFGLSQRLGVNMYKCGFSRGLTVETRLAHLRQTAYAACWRDGSAIVTEAGFDNWEATVLRVDDPRLPGSPVRVLPQGLAIDLPAGIDPVDLDRDLMQGLAPRALDRFATSEAGLTQCATCGLDAAQLRRLTRRDTKHGHRHRAARELFRLAPRQDARVLAHLIEALVARAASALLQR